MGSTDSDPLFLQIKEAAASVLEPFAGDSAYTNHGRRVVEGQRLMQAASDIFLGWTAIGERDYYVRQLRDMKGSIPVDKLAPSELVDYARVCGAVLGAHTLDQATRWQLRPIWAGVTRSTERSSDLRPRTPTRPRAITSDCSKRLSRAVEIVGAEATASATVGGSRTPPDERSVPTLTSYVFATVVVAIGVGAVGALLGG